MSGSENVIRCARCDRLVPSDQAVPPDEAQEDPSPAELDPEALVCPDCATPRETAYAMAQLAYLERMNALPPETTEEEAEDAWAAAGATLDQEMAEAAGMDDDDPSDDPGAARQ